MCCELVIVAVGNGGITPSSDKIPESEELELTIKEVKFKGYESIKSRVIFGVQDFAFPIFDYTGEVVAALVVPFVEYQINIEQIPMKKSQTLVKEAAENISKALGYKLDEKSSKEAP